MNLHRAYILLAAFYTLLILVGIVALLMGGGSLVSLVQLGIGALAVIGLWGYILGRGFMNPRMWRPLAYVLAFGALLQLAAVFTLSPSGDQLTWLLSSGIFYALLVAIIYRYGKRDQEIWATPEEIEDGRKLSELLSTQPELEVEKKEDDRKAHVKVEKRDDTYRASVTRQQGEQQEQFQESFSCPATLAFFLEKFTSISVDDFTSKYGNSGSIAS